MTWCAIQIRGLIRSGLELMRSCKLRSSLELMRSCLELRSSKLRSSLEPVQSSKLVRSSKLMCSLELGSSLELRSMEVLVTLMDHPVDGLVGENVCCGGGHEGGEGEEDLQRELVTASKLEIQTKGF